MATPDAPTEGDSARLLVVTGGAASDLAEVPLGVRHVLEGAGEILVVSPTLPSRLAWLVSDTDETREVADKRLQAVVGQLEDSTGASVEGAVGADDPLLAFEDAIADFHPHHILIALRPSEESGWQERGLIEEVGERFELPLTVFRITS